MYYVYLLECQEDKSWYIGYISDLQKRIKDHINGYGCRTTSLKNNWKLIYYEAYQRLGISMEGVDWANVEKKAMELCRREGIPVKGFYKH